MAMRLRKRKARRIAVAILAALMVTGLALCAFAASAFAAEHGWLFPIALTSAGVGGAALAWLIGWLWTR